MSTAPAPAPDWDAIRYRYVETDAALSAIIHDAGITHTQFETARKREDWRRKKPRRATRGRRPPASAISATTGIEKRRRNPGDAASPPEGATTPSLAPDPSTTDAPFVIPPVPTDRLDAANSAKARENVASLGTSHRRCQPQSGSAPLNTSCSTTLRVPRARSSTPRATAT